MLDTDRMMVFDDLHIEGGMWMIAITLAFAIRSFVRCTAQEVKMLQVERQMWVAKVATSIPPVSFISGPCEVLLG